MAREVEGLDEACGFVVRIDSLNGGADGRRCCCGIAALEHEPQSARDHASPPAPMECRTTFVMLVSNPTLRAAATMGDARLESA
jgi:hypothetical protein